jgi:hypothetical protein
MSLCRAAEFAVRDGNSNLAKTLATAAMVYAHTNVTTQGPRCFQLGYSTACHDV